MRWTICNSLPCSLVVLAWNLLAIDCICGLWKEPILLLLADHKLRTYERTYFVLILTSDDSEGTLWSATQKREFSNSLPCLEPARIGEGLRTVESKPSDMRCQYSIYSICEHLSSKYASSLFIWEDFVERIERRNYSSWNFYYGPSEESQEAYPNNQSY